MRCLALAEAWRTECCSRAIFLLSKPDSLLAERIISSGFEIVTLQADPGSIADAFETCEIAKERSSHWCVIDGYHFTSEYQSLIHDSGIKILFIDDYGHCDNYHADLILNQNIYARPELYKSCRVSTRCLLGTLYTLIRSEFMKYRSFRREIPELGCHILVTFGGSDPDNRTGNVLAALGKIRMPELEVIVVVGPGNPNYRSLQFFERGSPSVRILHNPGNMADLMAWADIAISAGGSTAYELAFMALPLFLYPIAENQNRIVEAFTECGAALRIRDVDLLDPDFLAGMIRALAESPAKRRILSQAMMSLVDGKGALRVIRAMRGDELYLRPVAATDCRMVWNWINDPEVRSQSFHSGKIPIEEHSAWFLRELSDPSSRYYIAMLGDQAIGQARFHIQGEEAVISVLLDRRFRGLKKGAELIQCATGKLFNESPLQTVHAYIKAGNDASYQSFIHAGYHDSGSIIMHGQDAHHLIVHRRRL
jgi:UDP-2,4-diacetamido-2,4,6-trideoxy-beta-L-altropyranose hydrolase